MILLTVKADMTVFALIACAFTLIEIATDILARGEGFGGHICGGLGGLPKAYFAHQEVAAASILQCLGFGHVLAKKHACSHKGSVISSNGVKFVDH